LDRIRKSLTKIMTRYGQTIDAPSFVGQSDFPFNKSYGGDVKLGGSVINAVFEGKLFAGTNFDCNQQYFNYEALAEAE
jgi:hypothetical protein